MTRRGNGEGSYREVIKNGVKYIEGRIRIQGKQYSRYAKTAKACRDKIDKLKFSGVPIKPSSLTVKQHLKQWLDNNIKISKSITTYENYKNAVDSHIVPEMEHLKVVDVNRNTIQQLINKKLHLSTSYVKLIKTVLNLSFKAAVLDGVITQNPVNSIILPKEKKKEIKIISKEDINKILTVNTDDDVLAKLAQFILMTGARRGEGVGLKWPDIDFTNSTVNINRSAVVTQDSGVIITSPKTKKSLRVVPLPATTIKLLKDWKIKQNKYVLSLGPAYNNQDYVFANDLGGHRHPDTVRDGLKRLLNKVGLETVTVHALRHSYATMLLELDENLKVVQEILGHSNFNTTANIYSHVSVGLKKQAITKIDELIK